MRGNDRLINFEGHAASLRGNVICFVISFSEEKCRYFFGKQIRDFMRRGC